MDYKTHIVRAIDYIEENLRYEIALSDCARVSGYSDYHFIRVFKEATGLTPADYMRKRRLTEIVKCMSEEKAISEIAFVYGFNSKENFTRAFVAEHHILPTEYKSSWNSLKLYEPIRFDSTPFEIIPEYQYLEPFVVTAYKSDVSNPPSFWNKYNSRKWSKKLSGGPVCEDYGVSVWKEKEKKLDYYIGIKKSDALGDVNHTEELYIQGGLYAVFTTPKASLYDFVNSIQRTWTYINCQWVPKSGYQRKVGNEFETYIEASRTFCEKIYIPLKEELI